VEIVKVIGEVVHIFLPILFKMLFKLIEIQQIRK
jgi:hypothetical protein